VVCAIKNSEQQMRENCCKEHKSHEIYGSNMPYLLECNAHLIWPKYIVKIRVRIRFDGTLDSIANLKNTADIKENIYLIKIYY
jgi:hypothetical protein